MIDDHLTQAEFEHLARVRAEFEQHTRAGAARRGRPPHILREPFRPDPSGRRWYAPAPAVPTPSEVRAVPAIHGGTNSALIPRRRPLAIGSARFHKASANRKLGPVDLVMFPGQPRPRPMPRRPFVSSTYVSIEATCPDSCEWKRAGCFADAGFTKIAGAKMDAAAAGRTPLEVIREEARLIRRSFGGGRIPRDGARGGRDLRLHVGGDVATVEGARELGRAAGGWRARGGGAVWSYTHWFREVPRAAWGPHVSVLASVESVAQFDEAAAAGYAPAIVVDRFERDIAYPIQLAESGKLPGWTLIPCPAETRDRTCATCRLCFDGDALLGRRVAIGFQAHGAGAPKMRRRLTVLNG